MVNLIIFGIHIAMEALLICIFFSAFAEPCQFRFRLIYIIACTFLMFAGVWIHHNPTVRVVVVACMIVCYSLMYQMKWRNRVCLVILYESLWILSEMFVAVLFSIVLHTDAVNNREGFIYVVEEFLSVLLTAFLVLLVRRARRKLVRRLPEQFWGGYLLLPLSSMISAVVMVDHLDHTEDKPMIQGITIGGIVLLVVANILFFYMIDRMYELSKKEGELEAATKLVESQKLQYTKLFEQQDKVRKIRHELKNYLISLKYNLEKGETDIAAFQVEEKYNELVALEQRVSCGESILDTIFLIKSEEAKKAGVILKINTELCGNLNISSMDLAVLLGNAIDNAIEATKEVTREKKEVCVEVILTKSIITILIQNPVNQIRNVENPETTKKEKELHGYGIRQMKSIAEKYGGEVLLECDDTCFTTSILLSTLKCN